MNDFTDINIDESILQNRLVSSNNKLNFFNNLSFASYCLSAIIIGVVIFNQFDVDGELSGFLKYVVAPTFILFGTYGLYRLITIKNLISITTNRTVDQTHIILLEFLKKRGYNININKADLIIVSDESSFSFDNLWKTAFIFILDNDKLYFNLHKSYPNLSGKGNPVVYFEHFILKYDLNRLFSKRGVS